MKISEVTPAERQFQLVVSEAELKDLRTILGSYTNYSVVPCQRVSDMYSEIDNVLRSSCIG